MPGATIRCPKIPRARRSICSARCSRPAITKARMDYFLYGSEHEAALRAAKRLGSGDVALAKARIAAYPQGAQHQRAARSGAARTAQRSRLPLQQDPVAAPRREIRRGRATDAERAEGSGPALQSGRMVDRTAAAVAQDARRRRTPHRLSDRARCGAARARHLQDRAGIHRGLDRAALSQRSRRLQRSILRASASAASTRPRWRAPAIGRAAPRKPPDARRKRAPPMRRRRNNRPAITANWRAPSSACPRSS